MRWLLLTVWLISLNSAVDAAEPDKSDQWHWVMTSPIGEQWKIEEGLANIEMKDGTIHIHLILPDGGVHYDFAGSIQLGDVGSRIRGTQDGTINAVATRPNSDISPSQFNGTYWKAILSESSRQAFGYQSIEVIALSNSVSIVGLVKETK